MFQHRHIFRQALTGLVTICIFSTPLFAQGENDGLTKKQENQINSNIYKLTSNAKTAGDFSNVIESCDEALAKSLSKQSQEFVVQIKSYCLNQRGSKRLDLADDFRAVNNIQQAETTATAAKSDFDLAIEIDKKRWPAYLNRAVWYAKENKFEDALADLNTALEINPGLIKALFNRAEINYHLGNYETAAKDYTQILETQSGNLQAITGRAHCWFAQGNHKDALQEYEIVLRLKPNDPIALVNRGDAHQALGNWKEAYEDYFASANSKPTAVAYQQVAWLLATCPESEYYQPDTAQVLIDKAFEFDDQSSRIFEVKAAVLATLGKFNEAISAQEKSIEMAQGTTAELESRLALYRENKAYQQVDPKK